MSQVSLALAKEFCEINHDQQDNVVQALIDGAEDFLAKHLCVDFTSDDFAEDLPLAGGDIDQGLPCRLPYPTLPFLLPSHRPVTELDAVVDHFDNDLVIPVRLIGDSRIIRTDDAGRPCGVFVDQTGRYGVTYTAGFAAFPSAIQFAVLHLVSRAYQARGGQISASAEGAAIAWEKLLGSDIMALVKDYSRRRVISV